MPFDGSGNYSPAPAPNFPAVGGTVISSAYYNAVINDIAAALSNTLTRDGQGRPGVDFNWNAKSLTNVNNLGAVTAAFSGLVTASGGISSTTGTFSSGLTVTGTVSSTSLNATGSSLAQYFGLNATGTATGVATGIFAPVGGAIGFSTGSTERLRVEAGGNVIVYNALTVNGALSGQALSGTTLNLSGTLTGQAINGTTGAFSGGVTVTGNLSVGGTFFPGATAQNIAADSTTLYLRGANVAWQDAGATTNRMYLSSAGRLGIGTTGPIYRLDVVSDDTATGFVARLRGPSSGTATARLQFTDNAASVEWGNIRATASGMTLANPSVFAVETAGSNRFNITSTGEVGVGTGSPGGVFEVRRDQAGATTASWVRNGATGVNTAASNVLATGSTNSFVNFSLVDANYRAVSNGSAVTTAFDDSNVHTFRTNAGVTKLSIDINGNIISSTRAAAVGYRGLPNNGTSGTYTLVLNDLGQLVSANNTVTIPTNATAAFDIGSAVTILNYAAGNITLSPAGGVTLVLAGTTTTGARTLAQNALVTLVKTGTDTWMVSGAGIS